MARLFISQERMDAWTAEDRITVDGDRLTLAGEKGAFTIVPAVRFLKVAGGDDTKALVGKVKGIAQLAAEGGEHYHDSVIVGDTAYNVQNGFLGTPLPQG